MKKDFWEKWKNKSLIEKKAINVVKLAREKIILVIPRDKLHSIYLKGSFVRREMNKKSDVDIVPIVTETKYEGEVFGVNSRKINPIIVVPLSLQELKQNKLLTKSNGKIDLRAKPDRFLETLNECKLIYGKSLNPKKFKIRSNRQALKDEIEVIKKGYIPYYEKGDIKFELLLKEVFWLTELEQKIKGARINGSFKDIVNSVKDKDHIIHYAIKFRNFSLKNKREEKNFVEKLKIHLENLKW